MFGNIQFVQLEQFPIVRITSVRNTCVQSLTPCETIGDSVLDSSVGQQNKNIFVCLCIPHMHITFTLLSIVCVRVCGGLWRTARRFVHEPVNVPPYAVKDFHTLVTQNFRTKRTGSQMFKEKSCHFVADNLNATVINKFMLMLLHTRLRMQCEN